MSRDYKIFQIANNNILPAKGNILISEPFINDKYFGRSVVLLVEHSETHGTMGFVLNKPMTETLNDFFPELKAIPEIPLFLGGPVSPNKLYFIHTLGEEMVPDTIQIGDGLYFDGDFDVIKNYLLEGNPAAGNIKFFLGYSGWDQDQLLQEIARNSWLVSKAPNIKMMKSEGEIYWKKSLCDLGDRYKSWANFPKQPFMN